jgi:uncharacterized protein with PQ loop repeat
MGRVYTTHFKHDTSKIYKIHITKKAGDISTTFIVVNIIGLVSYSIYGWYNKLVTRLIKLYFFKKIVFFLFKVFTPFLTLV